MVKKILLLFGLSTILYSCIRIIENEDSVLYVYDNQSGVDIVMEERMSDLLLVNTHNIPSGEAHEVVTGSLGGASDPPLRYLIRIIFDNSRLLEYRGVEDQIQLNIHNNESYVIEHDDKHDKKFTYIFTREMYESAMPLEP